MYGKVIKAISGFFHNSMILIIYTTSGRQSGCGTESYISSYTCSNPYSCTQSYSCTESYACKVDSTCTKTVRASCPYDCSYTETYTYRTCGSGLNICGNRTGTRTVQKTCYKDCTKNESYSCKKDSTCTRSTTCYRTATCDNHNGPCTSKRNKSCILTHGKTCSGYYDVIEWQDWSSYQSDSIDEIKSNQTCENIKRVQTRNGYVYNDNVVFE